MVMTILVTTKELITKLMTIMIMKGRDDHNNDNHRNEHNGNCNTDNIKIQEYQNSITHSIFDIPLLDCVCVFFALINFFFWVFVLWIFSVSFIQWEQLSVFSYHSTFHPGTFQSQFQHHNSRLRGSWQGHVTRKSVDDYDSIDCRTDRNLSNHSNHHWDLGMRATHVTIILQNYAQWIASDILNFLHKT